MLSTMTLDYGSSNASRPPRRFIATISVIASALASIVGIIAFGLSFTQKPNGRFTHPLASVVMFAFLYLPAVFIGFITAIVSTVRRNRHRDLVLVAWLLIAIQLTFWTILLSVDASSVSYHALARL